MRFQTKNPTKTNAINFAEINTKNEMIIRLKEKGPQPSLNGSLLKF